MKISVKRHEIIEPSSIADIEKESQNVISEIIQKKRQHEKEVINELDAGFYFSVVFRTRVDRDAWLREHDIKLQDDEYIFSTQLDERMV